uniref:ATP-dependent DNA helicase n=1 Tax=Tanacetum cinerariifolium TaxID=118510 RepID=A0A699HG77_TANCI|nr:DNA helicase [Tanacetum cinerariifolium]
MSMNMYYAYQIHDRVNCYSLLPRGGKLFQQYMVTAYCAIEQARLDYILQNQNEIRNEYLSGIYDAIIRYALAICRVHGNPSFFITFTCNAKWPEIQEYMDSWPELTTADRADIVDRVFKQKVRNYIRFVRTTNLFGDIIAVLYTIEFQKRGLPHCHSLLWVSPSTKVHQDTNVDKYISAELPDPTQDPNVYRIISDLMMHGPCGYANKNASCMKDGNKCNRNFPKPYCDATYIDKYGFVHSRRRDTNISTKRQEVCLDNAYIVPFNRTLCMRFYAHINVKYYGWTILIKYLFKYISKGTNRVVANITTPIGASATTRPAVLTLVVHLENMQQIRFRSKDNLQAVVDNPTKKKTTLTEWTLEDFGLPMPPRRLLNILENRVIMEERNYNRIASLLLPSERTAHSRFKIPLNLNEECICSIKNCQLADLLRETDLIIWDETPMNDLCWFEALDRCLRDILDNPETPFGGKSIIFGGDFRQTLLVKKKASKFEILDASITSSYLESRFKVYTLHQNMRPSWPDITEHEKQHIQRFSSWLLDIGDGNIGEPNATDEENSLLTHIPDELYIPNGDTKVIVCPNNETADTINSHSLSLLNEQERVYLSSDEATPHCNDDGETELLYPSEYLNSLNFPGLPHYRLQLKVRAPIILLRNLNLTGGLCNGTRMIVTQLLNKVIEARIITGNRISEKVFLPRISIINRDMEMPFLFKRKQFLVKISYAMTINKSQGQSLEKIGVFLSKPVFAHG